MTLFECKELIASDIRRLRNIGYGGGRILFHFSFIVTFWYRILNYLSLSKTPMVFLLIPYVINKVVQLVTGIQIPRFTKIGKGVCFMHHSCIVIAGDSIIGDNCSIHQGVTIGRSFSGDKAGCPVVGNNVIIFAGAKILGNVHIGDNVIIAANAVVIRDVPDNCVVAGVPSKIINTDSSSCIDGEWRRYFY